MDVPALPIQPSFSSQSVDQPLTAKPQQLPFRYIAPIIVFILGVILIPAFLMLMLPKSEWFGLKHFMVNYMTGQDYIFVKNQPFEGQFIVRSVRMSAPGYLILITSDQLDSPNENIIGTSAHLSTGNHSNVPIIINKGAQMDNPETQSLVPLGPPFWQPGAAVFVALIKQDEGEPMINVWEWAKDSRGVPVIAKTRVL